MIDTTEPSPCVLDVENNVAQQLLTQNTTDTVIAADGTVHFSATRNQTKYSPDSDEDFYKYVQTVDEEKRTCEGFIEYSKEYTYEKLPRKNLDGSIDIVEYPVGYDVTITPMNRTSVNCVSTLVREGL